MKYFLSCEIQQTALEGWIDAKSADLESISYIIPGDCNGHISATWITSCLSTFEFTLLVGVVLVIGYWIMHIFVVRVLSQADRVFTSSINWIFSLRTKWLLVYSHLSGLKLIVHSQLSFSSNRESELLHAFFLLQRRQLNCLHFRCRYHMRVFFSVL